ncbi:hypothetical protein BVC71_08900 [Marivivens niveibacter]|uniref:Xylose isomerase-like TIM barrel domain-containing protein n=1 Tax=Marivivens niveibacter TaxID=1930667 RepID=A0A251WWH3_9RHOB|nr:TIM barrel protein [Marivivens niveibacter]OUD08830.1 hypothetical protein BVC71_08900 [Marivivens niveibacter]
MSRLFSLEYLTCPGLNPVELTHCAADAGYDAVSYRLIHMGVAGEPDCDPCSPQMVRNTKQALADRGLQAFDVELARILRDHDPREYERAFAAGAELGCTQAISSAWTDVRNDGSFVVEQFQRICEVARPYGITVNLEFPAFSRLTCLDDALGILRRAQCENQGVLVDTLYHHFNGGTAEELLSVPDKWINFFHVCDTDHVAYAKDEMIHIARDARLYPGEGVIDFASLAAAIPHAHVAIELPNLARQAELGAVEHARRCLEGAKRFFSQPAQETTCAEQAA